MYKIKRRKIIKRVYEKGREKTIIPVKKPVSAIRQITGAQPAPQKIKPKLVEQPAPQTTLADTYELPSQYGVTRLALLVKDPFWIYAYWEITPNDLDAARSKLPKEEKEKAKIILRMYNITLIDFNGKNANNYFDIEVGYNTNNWYIKLWQDSVSYVAEIGLLASDKRFFPLARSNYVQTPRATYSPRTEQMWMEVNGKTFSAPFVVPRPKIPQPDVKSSDYIHKAIKKRKPVYLSEEDVRRYYSRLNFTLRDIISSRLASLYGRKARKYAFLLEGESPQERQKILSRLPKDYFIRRMLLGSSEELVLFGQDQRHLKGASEFVQERIKQHKFFFEISTELIVYGRTEPDAQVWLGDKKIKLRNDGTFSLRFALPDGKLPLGFGAIASDKKEIKKINTNVERSTNTQDLKGEHNA